MQIFPKVQGWQLLVLAFALRNLPGTHAKQYAVLQSSTHLLSSTFRAQPEAVPSKVAELPPLQSNAVFGVMLGGNDKAVNFCKCARSGTVPLTCVSRKSNMLNATSLPIAGGSAPESFFTFQKLKDVNALSLPISGGSTPLLRRAGSEGGA